MRPFGSALNTPSEYEALRCPVPTAMMSLNRLDKIEGKRPEWASYFLSIYMAVERYQTLDLTDPAMQQALQTDVPLIQQGRGLKVF